MGRNRWVQADVERLVEAATGTVSRLLSSERKPGRELAERFRVKLGLNPQLWDKPARSSKSGRDAQPEAS